MKVKVTDPCYVISNEAWDELCGKASQADAEGKNWSEAFEGFVEEYLQEKTGVKWATAGGTGYGDWGNSMSGEAVKKADFFADAGMWCVVPYEFMERDDMDPQNGAAILEFDKGSDIIVGVHELNDGQWTEFSVSGLVKGKMVTSYSEPFRSEEDDDLDDYQDRY